MNSNGRLDEIYAELTAFNRRLGNVERHLNVVYGTAFPLDGGNNKEATLMILSVDFDGVLHSYTSGWVDAVTAEDPPVPGAYDFLLAAVEAFTVCVFSSRSNTAGGRDCMVQYCQQWFPAVVDHLHFPEHKPPALVTLDDRAVCFDGRFPDVGELAEFRPWNKR